MKNPFSGMGNEQKMLIGSLAAGLIAAALAFLLVSDVKQRLERKMEPVQVVAASKYIAAFAAIDAASLKTMAIPRQLMTKAHVTDMKSLIGKRTVVPFIESEPIMINKVADLGSELNTIVPTGMRAISISVTKENSVSYMLTPGDFVDVLLTYETTDSNNATTSSTVTILQAVQIIAVGDSLTAAAMKKAMDNNDNGYNTITLALNPQDSEVVTFALEKGRLNFVLRPVGDKQLQKVKPVSFPDINEKARLNSLSQAPPAQGIIQINPPAQTGTAVIVPAANYGNDGITRKVIE